MGVFHKTFRPLMAFSQVCGLMPLRGIFGDSLQFTWTNPVHLYAAVLSSICIFFDVVFTIQNLKGNLAIDKMASSVFYTSCLLTTFLFLRVAQRMPEVGRDFESIEEKMKDYEEPKGLGTRIELFFVIFLVMALVEHSTRGVLNIMKALGNTSNEDFGAAFYEIHFSAVSEVVPYSGILTIILFVSNVVNTLNWNYLDFFLTGIALELSAKFEQISNKLSTRCRHSEPDSAFWNETYQNFVRIVLLTKKLDRILSGIILISFFSNIYHLSLQLLRSLSISGTPFQKLYFYFSLSYLVLRLLTTLFCLAGVSDAARKPKDLLFSVENHCVQSLRFLQQVLTDEIYFTGSRFFVINRSFAFRVMGTLVTFQAILLQFNLLNFVD